MYTFSDKIFHFTIGESKFGIPLSTVDRVIRAVAVTTVPNAPPAIYGLIDYYGVLVPVVNLRQHFQLPAQPVRVDDVFIIAASTKRKIALVADKADGVIYVKAPEIVTSSDVEPVFESAGLLKRDDGIIFIYDIEKFLSMQEEIEIQQLLSHLTQEKI
jgi:purine-binding chemotaxis protein CheW